MASFDGGSAVPSDDERKLGWRELDDAMVLPSLRGNIDIPRDGFDEWQILEKEPTAIHPLERSVNVGGFRLAGPREIAGSYDPTWERDGLDRLYPIQQAFWAQLDRLQPLACIGMGDFEIIVTTDTIFVDLYAQSLQQQSL